MKSLFFLLLLSFLSCTKSAASKRKVKIKLENGLQFNFIKNYSVSKKTKADVKNFCDTTILIDQFNGQVCIQQQGKTVYFRAKGIAFHSNSDSLTKKILWNTPMHVASVSKPITAICIMKLIEKKKINLNDSLGKFFPKIAHPEITIKQLLNHRSGLPYYGYFSDSILNRKFLDNQELIQLLSTTQNELYFPSNKQFAYCNTNYALLASIAEKVYNKAFPSVAYELVFKPLNMKNSYIFPYIPKNKIVARSYNSKNKFQKTTELDFIYGDKNLYTTAEDLCKFGNALIGSDFIPAKLRKEMWHGYSYEKAGVSNYGLGFRLKEKPGFNTLIFHTGWWHGNTAYFAILPKEKVVISVISNHYTKRIYNLNQLATYFGHYPVSIFQGEKEKEQS